MKGYLSFGVAFGLISAILCVGYFYLTLLLGNNPLGGSKAISYFLMLGVFFFLLWSFRTKEKVGILHFHQGLFVVLIEHLVACSCFALFIWFSLQHLHPDLLKRHKEESIIFLKFIQKDLVKTIGEEGFSKGLIDISSMTPVSIALDEFKKRFTVLLFFGLIASFIMRRSPNTITAK